MRILVGDGSVMGLFREYPADQGARRRRRLSKIAPGTIWFRNNRVMGGLSEKWLAILNRLAGYGPTQPRNILEGFLT